MLRWLKERSETGRRAEELYGGVVTAARQPAFYGIIGVPDTPIGRFEMVALHLFLAIESLRGRENDNLKQRMIEMFVSDLDDCMREMGVGDLAVPKKVKRAAGGFYERATSYRRGLTDSDPDALNHDLTRYIFAETAGHDDAARRLASYLRAASTALEHQAFDDWIESGAAHRLLDCTVSQLRKTTT